jgi:hypothetical protein
MEGWPTIYKCANAESVLAVIKAYTDPKTRELMQAIKRAYQGQQDAIREIAQFLIDHPQYPAAVVAGWLKWDDEAGIDELRHWAKSGFKGDPSPSKGWTHLERS